jgi:hypothetical protein
MTRSFPIQFSELAASYSLRCPRCGGVRLKILGATLFEQSSDSLIVRTTQVGAGRPFVREQASGGAGSPSPCGNAITIQIGCLCSQGGRENPPILALFENRGQIDLAWLERDATPLGTLDAQ